MHLVGNRYRIKSLIGEGGMASVYSAIDEKLDRRVAVKILHAHLGRIPDIRRRFHLEAKSISGIDHPNIIKVFDFSGDESEQLWIVTEILYGVDLSEFVSKFKSNRLHPMLAAVVIREVCDALDVVHSNGIVHRDIKSENIMMLDVGSIKLMDFGIAKVAASQSTTQTGTFMGSPSYMSVEQVKGVGVDTRSDIYSLNVLFYEIATGSLPYMGNSTADVISKIMHGTYNPPKHVRSSLPQDINDLIVWGLQKDKEKRPKSITEYKHALDRILAERKIYEASQALQVFFRDPHLFFKMSALNQEDLLTPPLEVKPGPKKRTKVVDKLIRETLADLPPQKRPEPPKTKTHVREASRSNQHKATKVSTPPKNASQRRPRKKRKQTYSSQKEFYAPKKNVWMISLGVVLVAAMLVGGVVMRSSRSNSNKRVVSKPPNIKKVVVPSSTSTVSKKKTVFNKSKSTVNTRKGNRPRITPRASTNSSSRSRPQNQLVKRSKPQGAGVVLNTPRKIDPPITSSVSSRPPARPSTPDPSKPGVVRISSRPSAEIYIDNQLFGNSNDRTLTRRGISLNPGAYTISLKRAGYEEFSQRVRVVSGQNVNLNIAMKKTLSAVTFRVQTNRLPTKVEIQGLPPSNLRRTMNLLSNAGSMDLFPGAYRIIATYKNERIERTINLGSESFTFNARFDL